MVVQATHPAVMIQIKEYAFTGYPVIDMGRARAFYEGLFGLKPSKVFEHEGHAWIEYDLGGATFAISDMAPEWKPSSAGPTIAFEVADFDAAIADLRAAKVKFLLEPAYTGVCNMAVVADPDGNSLTIHKRQAG